MSRHFRGQPSGGRHELGQNFLVDRSVITDVTRLVAATDGPILEIGPGDGALTRPLSRLGRPLTAVEVDPRRAKRLAEQTPAHVTVVNEDILFHRLTGRPGVVVGNVPFHITTATLRWLLAAPHWRTAVLLVQWEVARRRAGIGGASLLTARMWPWFDFTVHSRVSKRAFRPMPTVDGGLLVAHRRDTPLVTEREPYQRFVHAVFTGRGYGLREILTRSAGVPAPVAREWLRANRLSPTALPRDLTAEQWAALWTAKRGHQRS
ncbi:23S ribosomal RNA methyltransferase Erm [Asanoa sp. WMMD1127]|uniref:23S ribosomal RNA methyltransferase Erm n=1 Tax=Asanoa sp. WMMD1127 TaxID=3016107 RepID=UPI0024169AC4|nr:23S ribosomal RNA methyltransferase Erm [Asanoa sp. WMMD1127]MDG4821445.1 23S ribosomal RNA methyltransferase Erm [Asanoa sp. WMMD1127]